MVERYVVPAYGPDEKALAVALVALETLGEKHDCEVAIVVPALKHASGTILARVLTEPHAKRLANGEKVRLGKAGVVCSMASPLTLKNSRAKVFLGAFASPGMIEKVEGHATVKAIVILPWAGEEDVAEWKSQHSPTVLSLPDES